MPLDYPLRFQPVFRRYLWGGRGLGTRLNKPIGEGNDWAESWEVVDHGKDQSIVAAGALEGKTLHHLVTEHGPELFGRHHPQSQFPLLFKYLDANQALSVQVHPNDDYAKRMTPPDLGKTEAWFVVHAEPGSRLYAGLKRGFDRDALAREVARGTTELCMHVVEPKAGDCVFIPAGIPHALGAGLVIAEIQQASDTTFRLYDWNRVGPDGKPRDLHIEQGLAVINYLQGPIYPQVPQPTDRAHVERLVACDKFVLDRWSGFTTPEKLGGDERFHIVSVVAGRATIGHVELELGQTALLPAAAGEVEIRPETGAVLLDMYLP
jgi:mannose-6-phosphate isomerase